MNVELPQGVDALALVIGRERALYLTGQLPQCGSRKRRRFICIPKPARLKPDHQLVRILGQDDARHLSEAMGGEVVELATCRELERRWRDLSVRRLYRQGYDLQTLADMFNLSRRRIRWIINGC